ncbi:Flp pilus assembly protein TadG [Hoeflea marina]|uniref:Flp pilus assembly protein TadG n=1 Tax=Hoeflea marina TaxID=274592 RepID=A0A317PNM8_9HYPH|nr:TadE/TadG family type IV pilus assembly protein [Hoeflea marina]PWW02173.1 Flp pilus assembly protein TadG [Hoeflea marina]
MQIFSTGPVHHLTRSLKAGMARLRAWKSRRGGNFAVFSAISIPLFMMAASLAIDTANVTSLKVRLQNAADSAALATSTRLAMSEILEADAAAFATQFFQGQIFADYQAFSNMSAVPEISIGHTDDDGRVLWRVAVDVTGSQSLSPMSNFVGSGMMNIRVHGASVSAASSKSALSMVLVLDKSGSMKSDVDGRRKIDLLKASVGDLMAQLDEADPESKFVRTGADSYDSALSATQPLDWGTTGARAFVEGLQPEGRTDSTDAFKWALAAVLDDSETEAHKIRNELIPDRMLVFMTDGENTYSSADSSTRRLCEAAKVAKVEIYTVAFDAPSRGRDLLSYCATSTQHYFDARNSADLARAFRNIGLRASKMIALLVE